MTTHSSQQLMVLLDQCPSDRCQQLTEIIKKNKNNIYAEDRIQTLLVKIHPGKVNTA